MKYSKFINYLKHVSQLSLYYVVQLLIFKQKNRFVRKYVDLFCWKQIVDNNLKEMPYEKK
jgi:hypothetical protein